MKINVSKILKNQDSSMEFDGEVRLKDFVYMGSNIHIGLPVKVKALITNLEDHLYMKGNLKAELMPECSRCLQTFKYKMDVDFEEELSNKDAEEDRGDVLYFEGDFVDLTEIIENNILLSLPMKFLCRKDCKGLCPHCGANLNLGKCKCTNKEIDPRLSVLGDFFKSN